MYFIIIIFVAAFLANCAHSLPQYSYFEPEQYQSLYSGDQIIALINIMCEVTKRVLSTSQYRAQVSFRSFLGTQDV